MIHLRRTATHGNRSHSPIVLASLVHAITTKIWAQTLFSSSSSSSSSSSFFFSSPLLLQRSSTSSGLLSVRPLASSGASFIHHRGAHGSGDARRQAVAAREQGSRFNKVEEARQPPSTPTDPDKEIEELVPRGSGSVGGPEELQIQHRWRHPAAKTEPDSFIRKHTSYSKLTISFVEDRDKNPETPKNRVAELDDSTSDINLAYTGSTLGSSDRPERIPPPSKEPVRPEADSRGNEKSRVRIDNETPSRVPKLHPQRSMERTYRHALELLEKVESNKTAISKSTAATPAAAITAGSAGGGGKPSTSTNTSLEDFSRDMAALRLDPATLVGRGPPPFGFRAIHVAGTKGKGSVVAYCTSLLLELRGQQNVGGIGQSAKNLDEGAPRSDHDPVSGESKYANIGKIGTYTSPHLVDVRERICIDGKPVSETMFTRYFFEVWDLLSEDAARRISNVKPDPSTEFHVSDLNFHRLLTTPADRDDYGGDNIVKKVKSSSRAGSKKTYNSIAEWAWGPKSKPFFFRLMTLLAFYIFVKEGVSSAVVEVGIGGLHDPTNILPPDNVSAAVVTQLGLDHTGMLGNTVEQIAEQKAGIFKPGMTAVTRFLEKDKIPVMNVLRRCAKEKDTKLLEVRGGVNFPSSSPFASTATATATNSETGTKTDAPGRMGGSFQAQNRALALFAVREHLRCLGLTVPAALREVNPKRLPSLTKLPPEWMRGLGNARLRGRCEILPDTDAKNNGITWYLDGAHTTDSLSETGRWFIQAVTESVWRSRSTSANICLVFNQADRDAVWLLDCLTSSISRAASRGVAKEMRLRGRPKGEAQRKRNQWGQQDLEQQEKQEEEDEDEEEEREKEQQQQCTIHPLVPGVGGFGRGARSQRLPALIDFAIFTRNEVAPPAEGDLDLPRKTALQMACKRAAEMEGMVARSVVTDNVTDAVRLCREWAVENGEGRATDVLVTGSLHLVGSAIKVLELLSKPETEPEA